MHLKTLGLRNFRSFGDSEVSFCSDLTILVGENNGGKSNTIDAIRLLTTPLSGRREIYCESTDIRFGGTDKRFDLKGTFLQLSPAQQGRLLSATADESLESAVFGLSYDESDGTVPTRPLIWAGHLKGVPEPGCLQMVRHVYLPPLRDAKRALASGNPTRIYTLLQHFLGGEKPDELAKRLKRDTSPDILTKIDSAVDVGLAALTSGVRRQGASLGFATDEKLIDIARDLRFKLADQGIAPEDLRYSGHGYANLLYMATIAVELEKVNNADLTLFLVEEPEAHLHPQLQAAVLSFLEDQSAKSKDTEPHSHGPAGEVQVVVATHSPNLSAWVASRKLVVLRSLIESSQVTPESTPEPQPEIEPEVEPAPNFMEEDAIIAKPLPVLLPQNKLSPHTDATPPIAQSLRRVTQCVPLHELGLDETQWRKVDRYLDVTKSALLFGGRVLLVEGIAEALLLPVIARKHVLRDRPDQLRIFRSSVFVPIDGVDFEPYVRLLLTPFRGIRIADRVVVMTDGDGSGLEKGQTPPGKVRKDQLDTIAAKLMATEIFDVFISRYSLETELIREGNSALLRQVYLALRPKSGANWDTAVSKCDDAQALAIQTIFQTTRKGDFAQLLADKIDQDEEFKTPGYIVAAIEALVR